MKSKHILIALTLLLIIGNAIAIYPKKAQATFSPATIPDLKLWLHTDDLTTLTGNPNDTVGAGNITDGTAVAKWFDASGNGYTASQSTVASRPIFHTNGSLNNQPYITFNNSNTASNGSGNFLGIDPSFLQSLDTAGSYSFTWVYYQMPGQQASYQIFSTSNDGGAGKYFFVRLADSFDRYNAGSTAALSQGTPHILTYTFQQSSGLTGTETFYIDGVNSFQVTDTLPSDPGVMFCIGADCSGNYALANSEFYQELSYGHALTDTERVQLESYLGNKYGITTDTNVGPLTAGTSVASNVQKTAQTISASPVTGGTGPYTYQWYRSTTSGPLGNALSDTGGVSGSQTLNLNDAGLTAQTNYYYTLKVTDSVNAVAYSTQLTAPTHGSKTIKIGFVGDSISAQDPGQGSPPQNFGGQLFSMDSNLDPQIINDASSGEQVRNLSGVNGGGNGISNYINDFTAKGVTWVLVEEGTNDAGQQAATASGYSNAQFQADYANIISQLVGAGFKVIVNDITYTTDTPKDPIIQNYNTYIANTVDNTNVFLGSQTDYSYFFAHQSELRDGLHPTQQGAIDLATQWINGGASTLIASVTGPAFSGVTVTPSTTGATITYTTDKIASTKVNYGTTSGYGSSTATTNTSPRVLSHSVTLSALSACTPYHYQLDSIDGNGNESLSNDASFTTTGCASAPGAPTSVVATAGNAQASVSFVAPVSNGGSAITGYTVISNPAGGTDADAGTTALTHTVTGLTNGTPYTFTVTATNGVGTSSASTASSAITPASSGGGGNGGIPPVTTPPVVYGGSGGGGAPTGILVAPLNSAPLNDGSSQSSTPSITVPTSTAAMAPALIGATLVNDHGTYYLVTATSKLGITNPGILQSYGYTFAQAQPPTSAEEAMAVTSTLAPNDGALVKTKADPTVYLISGQQKYGFASAKVFSALGYKFTSVVIVTTPELNQLGMASVLSTTTQAHLAGTLVSSKGVIYLIGTDGMLHAYPSVAVYNSWNKANGFGVVVPANGADLQLPIGSIVTART